VERTDSFAAGFVFGMQWTERRAGEMIRHVMLEAEHEFVVVVDFVIVGSFIETLIDESADLLLEGAFAVVVALAERSLFKMRDFEVVGTEATIGWDVCGLHAASWGRFATRMRFSAVGGAHLLAESGGFSLKLTPACDGCSSALQ
jgi:hypothetical protein